LLRLRTDEQLVVLFRAGHDEAFRTIHDRYRQRLFAYARQMLAGSRSDAEDALQDVFLRAYGALRADGRPVTLRAWLYRVAHNRCVDQLRRPAPAPADIFDLNRTPLHDPMVEAERREDLLRLVADVGRLPEQQRSALLMREMEGLSYAELSGALGVSIPAVKSLLVRARVGLVEAIEARDTACVDIRDDIAAAHDRGVRTSSLARRHLRECVDCREYRCALRGVERGLAGLAPGPGPLAWLAKLVGLGGAGSGAAAGGSAAAGGGAAAAGGGAAAVTATKVVAVVCTAAVVGGGAAEVQHQVEQRAATSAPQVHAAHHRAIQPLAATAAAIPASPMAPLVKALRDGATAPNIRIEVHRGPRGHSVGIGTGGVVTAPGTTPSVTEVASGGLQAPDEQPSFTDDSASSPGTELHAGDQSLAPVPAPGRPGDIKPGGATAPGTTTSTMGSPGPGATTSSGAGAGGGSPGTTAATPGAGSSSSVPASDPGTTAPATAATGTSGPGASRASASMSYGRGSRDAEAYSGGVQAAP
jgi:RNA polymerase sigma factor (sigma-70 family)